MSKLSSGLRSTNKPNIIFDITGVLFKENKLKIIRQAGIFKLLLYLITHKKNPVKIGFGVFKKMQEEEQNDKNMIQSKYKNYIMPNCITEWMKGIITNKTLLEKVESYIEHLKKINYFKSNLEKELVRHTMKLLLDEEQIHKYLKPIDPMIELVKKLKNEGKHNLFIISNYAKQASELLIEQYKTFFSLFDDIIISANIGLSKPEPTIYQHLIGKHSLKPTECIFIDDQEENIEAANNLGMTGILFMKYNNFEKSLKKLKIL